MANSSHPLVAEKSEPSWLVWCIFFLRNLFLVLLLFRGGEAQAAAQQQPTSHFQQIFLPRDSFERHDRRGAARRQASRRGKQDGALLGITVKCQHLQFYLHVQFSRNVTSNFFALLRARLNALTATARASTLQAVCLLAQHFGWKNLLAPKKSLTTHLLTLQRGYWLRKTIQNQGDRLST